MTTNPHDLIPAVLREFGPKRPADFADSILATVNAINAVAVENFRIGQEIANLEKPTRAELLIENARLERLLAELTAENAKMRARLADRYGQNAIVTEYWPKPIPTNSADWQAHRRDYEPGMALGHGKDELEAITALLTEEDERDD